MSVEKICEELLREPFVCKMLTTEYKSVVNIPDNVQFFCMVCQGISMPLIPLVPQVGDSNVVRGRSDLIANGRSSLLLKYSLNVREQRSMERQLTELTQIFEPKDSCFDLVSLELAFKHSKLGLCCCQLYSA